MSHNTIKPLEVFERPIRNHTNQGELVYEPFLGSSTQIIAAARTGRRCYGMELSPAFADVGRTRWGNYARVAGIDPGPDALFSEEEKK
jgi:DNA modification methylase